MRKIKNHKRPDKIYILARLLCLLFGSFFIYLFFTFTPERLALDFTADPSFPRMFEIIITIFDYISLFLGLILIGLAVQKAFIKKHGDKIFLVFITLMIFFLIGEAFAAIVFFLFPHTGMIEGKMFFEESKDSIYTTHPYLNYVTSKNYNNPSTGDAHNSLGFRGEEINVKKSPGVFRIVALGGSTTYDVGLPHFNESYPYQLQQILNEKYPSIRFEVINAGVGGYTSWETLINFAFRVVPLEPDLIISYDGINDVHSRLVNPKDYLSDNSGARKQWSRPDLHPIFNSRLIRMILPLNTFGSVYYYVFPDKKMVAGVTSNDYNPKIGMTPQEALNRNKPVYFESNIKSIIGIARINNISVMLTSSFYYPSESFNTTFYQQGLMEHNSIMENLSKSYDTYFCDLKSSMPIKEEYFIDCAHLNKKGNFIKASIISDCILSQVLGLEGENGKE